MKNLFTLLLTLFSGAALSSTDPQAALLLAQKSEAIIIDVREQDEIKSGMIQDAKWFPLSKILNNKNWKTDFSKLAGSKKIFLYCRSGKRSANVMNILKENGIASENIGGYETLKKTIPTR